MKKEINMSKEEFNSILEQFGKELLKEVSENVEADLEPMGWLAEQHLAHPFKEGEDYEIGISRGSITEVLDKVIAKYKK